MTILRQHIEVPLVRSCRKVIDTSGSSLIIGLVFFLICAVIGSTILTAASINAKTVATHQETNQAEYTVGSAAQVIAAELSPFEVTFNYKEAVGNELSSTNKVTFTDPAAKLAKDLWANNVDRLWKAHIDGTAHTVGGAEENRVVVQAASDAGKQAKPVYASITFDRDFNITVRLSSDKAMADTAAYNQTVTLQATPTYDQKGRLLSCSWASAVITKSGGE